MREGESFAGALERRGVFPDVAVKMAEVGESTGALQDMLNTVADFYDEEIATNMERFVTLIEPVLLVIMGLVIAGLLLALYMPLFQLSSVLAPGSEPVSDVGRLEHRWLTSTPRRFTSSRPSSAPTSGGPSSSRRAGWPSATGSSSSTWTRSGSIRSCSGRSRPT